VGSLTTGNVTHSDLSRTNEGWHLIGNPYTSAIEWNNNSDWVFTNIGTVPNIWGEASGTYVTPADGDPIPATNGFFVQVASGFGGNNKIKIPASARIHSTQNNYKKAAGNRENYTLRMKVTTTANTFYNEIRVGFKDDATQEWDLMYDAHKLFTRDVFQCKIMGI